MRSIWIGLSITALTAAGMANAQDINVGKYEYLSFCASCHGATGKGDGPVANSLKRPPTDLTRLTEVNKGVFPFLRVYEVIDGRFEVATHGERDMPVWGQVYKPAWAMFGLPPTVPKDLAEVLVRARIMALAEHISTMQGK